MQADDLQLRQCLSHRGTRDQRSISQRGGAPRAAQPLLPTLVIEINGTVARDGGNQALDVRACDEWQISSKQYDDIGRHVVEPGSHGGSRPGADRVFARPQHVEVCRALLPDNDDPVGAVERSQGPIEERHAANPRRFGDVQDNAMYWNFVVVAWLPLYGCIYWIPRL